MSEEKIIGGNGGLDTPTNGESKPIASTPPTDFKIAEIWIRDGQLMLDASETFWSDRIRAIGVIEMCKDIVKNAQAPKPEKSKIVTPDPRFDIKGFVNRLRKKK